MNSQGWWFLLILCGLNAIGVCCLAYAIYDIQVHLGIR